MKIVVQVKPNSKRNAIERDDKKKYTVSVTAPPVDGKANAAVIKIIADHFDLSPSLVTIVSGHFSKTKIIEVHV